MAGRFTTGAPGATISRRPPSRWCPRSLTCSNGCVSFPGSITCACQAAARPASRLFGSEAARDEATAQVPPGWWHLATPIALEARRCVPILTAAAMRAAEQAAIDGGTPVETLMERAGAALAEAAYRFAGPRPTLVVVGPGNNGGDGYVAARHLASSGSGGARRRSRRAQSEGAKWARSQWSGAVEPLSLETPIGPTADRCAVRNRSQARARRRCRCNAFETDR